jgi:hypothetical protein
MTQSLNQRATLAICSLRSLLQPAKPEKAPSEPVGKTSPSKSPIAPRAIEAGLHDLLHALSEPVVAEVQRRAHHVVKRCRQLDAIHSQPNRPLFGLRIPETVDDLRWFQKWPPGWASNQALADVASAITEAEQLHCDGFRRLWLLAQLSEIKPAGTLVEPQHEPMLQLAPYSPSDAEKARLMAADEPYVHGQVARALLLAELESEAGREQLAGALRALEAIESDPPADSKPAKSARASKPAAGLKSLPDCVAQAHQSLLDCIEATGYEPSTDDAAYRWIKANKPRGYIPPSRGTWCRYIRAWREQHGAQKHRRRGKAVPLRDDMAVTEPDV